MFRSRAPQPSAAADAAAALMAQAAAVARDVQDTHATLLAANRVLDALRDGPALVWETDADGRYVFVEGAEDALGYAAADMLGRDRRAFFIPEPADSCAVALNALAMGEEFDNLLVRMRRRNGDAAWILASGKPLFDAAGAVLGFRGVDVDVTELAEARVRLEMLALHDPLTGLPNRRKLMDRFEDELTRMRRYQRPMSVMVVDLDHFKLVNDHHGHVVGDECLRSVAQVLRECLRGADLPARLGGEEFVALLPETEHFSALLAAEKLRCAIADQPMRNAAGALFRITASFGVATLDYGRIECFETVLERADAALYEAKRQGRNLVRGEVASLAMAAAE